MRGSASADGRSEGAGRQRRAAAAQERSFAKRSQLGGGPAEIAILDGDGRIVMVNEAWREAVAAYQLTARNWSVGATYADVTCEFLPPDRATLKRELPRLLSGKIHDLQHTFAIQSPNGPRWLHIQITSLSTSGSGRFVAIHDDQTALATTQEALKVTSGQLLTARDDERQRIAIELHDSTSQHLAAASLSLARFRRVSRVSGPHGAILDEIAKSLDEAVKETRVLAYLMKPRSLGQEGLSVTILQFLEGFARRTGLEVALEADGAVEKAPAPLQHAALRIVQEALLNANRHAEARRVSVELSVDDGLLKVSIVDDGHGMASYDGQPRLGVGIPGMQARAQQFAGELAISSDDSGTRVVALLPLP